MMPPTEALMTRTKCSLAILILGLAACGGDGNGGNAGSGGGSGGASAGAGGSSTAGSGGSSTGGSGGSSTAGSGGASTAGTGGSSSAGTGGSSSAGTGGSSSAGTGGTAAGGRGGAAGGVSGAGGGAGRGGSGGGGSGSGGRGGAGGATTAAMAMATIQPIGNNTVMGTATFTDVNGIVTLQINLTSCPNGQHAAHLHEFANCGSNGNDAGNHWVPKGEIIQTITCTNGTATSTTTAPSAGYWTIGGAASSDVLPHAVMIHASPDPNAGARIGCGVAAVTQ
jgi:Cu/Zn superoxide dismutase